MHAAQGTTPSVASQTAEELRWQKLRELQGAMAAKRCYSPPPEAEADQWILGFEDVDDEYGNTIKRGIPVWTPKAESDEWHRLRFAVNPDDGFVGSLAGRTTKVATIEEINAATAQGWAGKKMKAAIDTNVLIRAVVRDKKTP